MSKRSALAALVVAGLSAAGCGGAPVGRAPTRGGSVAHPSERPAAKVRALQRVGASGGWVLTSSELAWTAGPGAIGRAITPPVKDASLISSAYFLTPQHGWVGTRATARTQRGTTLTIFHTSDGGATWNEAIVGASPGAAEVSSLAFVDPRHGFLLAKDESSSNFSAGELFRTDDGGSTWTKAVAPSGGPIRFVTPSLGFMAGGPAFNELYRTTNGGESWQRLSLATPQALGGAQPAYTLPTFSDQQTGVLPVTLQPARGSPAVVFYRTNDGGASWVPADMRLVPEATGKIGDGVEIATAVVDRASWIVISPNAEHVYATADGGRSWKTIAPNGLRTSVEKIDFATSSEGWSLVGYGSCSGFKTDCTYTNEALWTTDGGQTWDVIRK